MLLEFVSLMIFFSFLAAQSNNIDMEDIIQQHVSDSDFLATKCARGSMQNCDSAFFSETPRETSMSRRSLALNSRDVKKNRKYMKKAPKEEALK